MGLGDAKLMAMLAHARPARSTGVLLSPSLEPAPQPLSGCSSSPSPQHANWARCPCAGNFLCAAAISEIFYPYWLTAPCISNCWAWNLTPAPAATPQAPASARSESHHATASSDGPHEQYGSGATRPPAAPKERMLATPSMPNFFRAATSQASISSAPQKTPTPRSDSGVKSAVAMRGSPALRAAYTQSRSSARAA